VKPILASALTVVCVAPACAQLPRDVPAGHWAAQSVAEVVRNGVMDAPGGRFNGARQVTRGELAITLARFARSIQQRRWTAAGARPAKPSGKTAALLAQPVSRYELAAVLSRTARYVAAGVPRESGKVHLASEALPRVTTPKLAASEPARESVLYLVRNRMAFGSSVALRLGPQAVTGKELAIALACVIAGLNDRVTDEPQNREVIERPRRH